MKLKSLTLMALIGTLLICGSASATSENKEDWTTTLNVKLALLNKLGTDSLHVDVDTNAGAVALTGIVHKRATSELAETVAESVKGVKSVKNDIKVEAMVDNPSKASAVAGEAEAEVKDAMLATKVRLALIDSLGSDGFRIGTETASGVVTLQFEKSLSAARRQEAIKVVNAVEGVHKVVSVDKT